MWHKIKKVVRQGTMWLGAIGGLAIFGKLIQRILSRTLARRDDRDGAYRRAQRYTRATSRQNSALAGELGNAKARNNELQRVVSGAEQRVRKDEKTLRGAKKDNTRAREILKELQKRKGVETNTK